MTDSVQHNVDDFEIARQAAEKAAGHYGAALAECQAATQGLKLTGGRGETGAYHDQLTDFADSWNANLTAFLQDEQAFVDFLGVFQQRLVTTQKLYQDNELRISGRYARIGQRFDEMGR